MAGSLFIVGPGRSGTTALIQALALSAEAWCQSEPAPNLNADSRQKHEGYLPNPHVALARDVGPRLAMGLSRAGTYIEKQVSLVPFMRELHAMYGARFIVPYRDGRDVVASLMNWHHRRYPIIYRETPHDLALSPFAAEVDAQVAARGGDPFDYSLPRPTPGDPWREAWPRFSRFEMCCWYWNATYDRIAAEAAALPPGAVLMCDARRITPATIAALYAFCGLGDFDEGAVGALLATRVNALSGLDDGPPPFPAADAWPEAATMRYFDLCWATHRRLGLSPEAARPLPAGFGRFWRDKGLDEAWYAEIDAYRATSHAAFEGWARHALLRLGLGSATELGVGLSPRYREGLFRDLPFIGIDLLPAVAARLRDLARPGHRFLAADVTREAPVEAEADLVFCHASIDNVPDPDAFLAGAARLARRALFVSTYRGFFPELRAHRIAADPATGVAFNDLSPWALAERARALGFATVAVVPYPTGRADIPTETALVASRDAMPVEALLGDFPVGRVFRPYRVQADDRPAEAIAAQVNRACAYYSDPVHGLAADPALFRQVLRDLKALPGRRLLPLRDFAQARHADPDAIGLRVDVDDDLVAATVMAGIAAEEGVRLTFFLLPTAPYHGHWQEGVFHRHAAIGGIARAMQAQGHEIGLHVDPFLCALDHGVDGLAATVAELDWLRGQGLRIEGISGHNCASHYGAEGVEVFDRFRLAPRRWLERRGAFVPLGTLDAAALGIAYEGSFLEAPPGGSDPADPFATGVDAGGYVASAAWMRRYLGDNPYARHGVATSLWVTGRDEWAMGHRDPEGRFAWRFRQPWRTISGAFAACPGPTLVVLHPNYFGRRAGPDVAPVETG